MNTTAGKRSRRGPPKEYGGFTLIELMIVVAIFTILAVVVIPKFANLIDKSKEGATKGVLASFRGAIDIYYSETEGMLPQGSSALVPHYLKEIPGIRIPFPTVHPYAAGVITSGGTTDWGALNTDAWYYNTTDGHIVVNCTHSDTKGNVWSTY